jgi:ferredoxin-thioredoxin reductase catalytic subunit
VTAVVIQGLAEHKDQLGAPLCPCRHYDDKEAEVAQGFWNCPCVPMRERKVRTTAAAAARTFVLSQEQCFQDGCNLGCSQQDKVHAGARAVSSC